MAFTITDHLIGKVISVQRVISISSSGLISETWDNFYLAEAFLFFIFEFIYEFNGNLELVLTSGDYLH